MHPRREGLQIGTSGVATHEQRATLLNAFQQATVTLLDDMSHGVAGQSWPCRVLGNDGLVSLRI